MIITIIQPIQPIHPIITEIEQPDVRGIHVSADRIVLNGESLSAITASMDGGYTYEPMQCGGQYSGNLIIKSTLSNMKGYSLQVGGNAKISGRLSDLCKGNSDGLFSGVIDVSDLLLDNGNLTKTFYGCDIDESPKFADMQYNMLGTFYGCSDLESLDFTPISENNLKSSKFLNFVSDKCEIKFNDTISDTTKNYINSQRYKQ